MVNEHMVMADAGFSWVARAILSENAESEGS